MTKSKVFIALFAMMLVFSSAFAVTTPTTKEYGGGMFELTTTSPTNAVTTKSNANEFATYSFTVTTGTNVTINNIQFSWDGNKLTTTPPWYWCSKCKDNYLRN